MYANNLFTLNNIPTLPAVQGGAGMMNNMVPGADERMICRSDKLFVSVVKCGRTVMERVFVGLESMRELIMEVKGLMGDECGLVTVNVRNGSQGWRCKRCVRMNPVRPMF